MVLVDMTCESGQKGTITHGISDGGTWRMCSRLIKSDVGDIIQYDRQIKQHELKHTYHQYEIMGFKFTKHGEGASLQH